jgi:hypothetical protein
VQLLFHVFCRNQVWSVEITRLQYSEFCHFYYIQLGFRVK